MSAETDANTPKWGIVSTIKASARDILNFAAHHIDLGAHRLYLYLDAPCPEAFDTLKAHPKVRVLTCDDAHWKKLTGKKPAKHQVRQTQNATHAYNRRTEVTWLAHIDADEFLWPDGTVSGHLARLPADTLSARVYPIEALAGGGTRFKGYIPPKDRIDLVERIYPQFGRFVKGGFLSHVAGKLFVRTGLENVELRIHNMFLEGTMNPNTADLEGVDLCHCHVHDWDGWMSSYRYRLEKGAYRAELAPAVSVENGGLTLHDMFTLLEAQQGETGLRAFFDEVCADTPELRQRLDQHGLLRTCDLELDRKRVKHFGT
ncbi:glycosyltransferase family 2 protein [Arenibacterium sp. CAU 1754]